MIWGKLMKPDSERSMPSLDWYKEYRPCDLNPDQAWRTIALHIEWDMLLDDFSIDELFAVHGNGD